MGLADPLIVPPPPASWEQEDPEDPFKKGPPESIHDLINNSVQNFNADLPFEVDDSNAAELAKAAEQFTDGLKKKIAQASADDSELRSEKPADDAAADHDPEVKKYKAAVEANAFDLRGQRSTSTSM